MPTTVGSENYLDIWLQGLPHGLRRRESNGTQIHELQQGLVGSESSNLHIADMVDIAGVLLDFIGLLFGDKIAARRTLQIIGVALVIMYYTYQLYRWA